MTTNTWKPNEKQQQFLEILKEYPDGITLRDLEIEKHLTFKTGVVNALVSKGLVETADGDYQINLVYRDTIIGSVKKVWKIYKLVSHN